MKYWQIEDSINKTLPGISSLGACGCSALFNLEIRSIIFAFPFSFTSQQKEEKDEKDGCGESLLMGVWGIREGAGLYAAVCSYGWFFYCLLLYVQWSHWRSVWGRGRQDLKWKGIATVLQSDFLNYSRCGILPCNSHNEANNFVTELGNCEDLSILP